ncbi:MAG: hypothetical protein ACRC2O_15015 [Chitinophagaceae bacterium]
MKNLLVPAAIAIGGLFVVNHFHNADLSNHSCSLTSKHEHARNHQGILNIDVAVPASEVLSNTIRVAYFAPITELVTSAFLIDFSDEQTVVSDNVINEQMELSQVEISVPDSKDADVEMMAGFTTFLQVPPVVELNN